MPTGSNFIFSATFSNPLMSILYQIVNFEVFFCKILECGNSDGGFDGQNGRRSHSSHVRSQPSSCFGAPNFWRSHLSFYNLQNSGRNLPSLTQPLIPVTTIECHCWQDSAMVLAGNDELWRHTLWRYVQARLLRQLQNCTCFMYFTHAVAKSGSWSKHKRVWWLLFMLLFVSYVARN